MKRSLRNLIHYTGMFSMMCAGWLFGDYIPGLPINLAMFPFAIIGVILVGVSVFSQES